MDNDLVIVLVSSVAVLAVVVLLVALLSRRGGRPDSTDQVAPLLARIAETMERTSLRVATLEASSQKETELLHQPMSKAVNELQKELTALQATAKQQHDLEQKTAASIGKLEMILAGTQAKGAAGEAVVETLLSHLPAEWQVRDFPVGNLKVEFGLRLPNHLVLPIDSKWVATNTVEQLATTNDPAAAQKLRSQIESTVRAKGKEVGKYVGSNSTANFGLLVLPDSVFEVSRRAHVDVFSDSRVVVVSSSLLMPYLLLTYHTALTSAKTINIEQLEGHIEGTLQQLDQLQSDINRIDRIIVSLRRTRERMDGRVSQLRSSAHALEVERPSAAELPTTPAPEAVTT